MRKTKVGNLANFRILLEQLHPDKVNYFILSDVKIFPDSKKMNLEKWWVIVSGEGEDMIDAVKNAEEILNIIKGED